MKLLRLIQRSLLVRAFRPVVTDDFRTWTGATLTVASWHVARQIARRSKAERVGILLPTSGLFPAATLAAWACGRTAVPLNYLLSRSDLEYIAKDAGLDAVVTVGAMLDHIGGPLPGIDHIRMDQMKFTGMPPVRLGPSRSEDWTAIILYTSGTSGRPKGVMLSERNLRTNVDQVTQCADFTAKDIMFGVLPQFHSFALTILTLLPLRVGCRVVYSARFVPGQVLECMRTQKPTVFVAIPSMYNALLLARSGQADDFASLRYIVSGSEPLPDKVASSFYAKFGKRISEGYGLTETSPVTNWCLPEEYKPHSVGRALPGVEERIVSPDGRVLGTDEDGEIRIRGANVMKGYYGLPELTAEAFDSEGYLKTGDMGRFDRDGHLFITGRIKEMLIISGENVFPREIEEVLNHHPLVKASAVVGLPDPARGEIPVAFVELHEGAAWDEASVRAHCREKLPVYKVPRDFRVLDALPRNPTGKVMRRALSEQVKAEA
ncbi:MAG: AMP-binding protein [Phycisphaerae bacterium]|nr:AMP-binding protein [Phycisphaerae bacterium]